MNETGVALKVSVLLETLVVIGVKKKAKLPDFFAENGMDRHALSAIDWTAEHLYDPGIFWTGQRTRVANTLVFLNLLARADAQDRDKVRQALAKTKDWAKAEV